MITLFQKYWTNVRESLYYETNTVGQFELFLIGSTKHKKEELQTYIILKTSRIKVKNSNA
jgi:hypothetical protein